jgi:hypothetical protein
MCTGTSEGVVNGTRVNLFCRVGPNGLPWRGSRHKRINKIKFTFGINNIIFFILFVFFF